MFDEGLLLAVGVGLALGVAEGVGVAFGVTFTTGFLADQPFGQTGFAEVTFFVAVPL